MKKVQHRYQHSSKFCKGRIILGGRKRETGGESRRKAEKEEKEGKNIKEGPS